MKITIPERFNYKSNINEVNPDIIYSALFDGLKYVVTHTNGMCRTYYSESKMRKMITKGDFKIIE